MTAQDAAVSAPVVSRQAPRRRFLRPEWIVRLASIAAVLGAWEIYARQVNPIFLRPPSAIVGAFGELISDGTLVSASLLSFKNLALGMAIALAVGLLVGVLSARSWIVFNATDPWVNALYSMPSVALVPFLTLWLGIGDPPKVAAIALFAVFPILINTQQGVRYVDRNLLEVARSFCSSERQLWTDVLLPAALPFILAGTRLAIGRGLVGMIVSEFLTSFSGGLGALIITFQNLFAVDRMFVPVIVVSGAGIVLMGLVQAIETRVAPWARRES